MGGRPRALDDAKRREVCALISTGCGIDGAARYVGCSPITIRREALRNPEFHEQLREAELSAQMAPLQAMRNAASTHWRAAAWFLERTQPLTFAPRRPLTLTVEEASFYLDRLMEIFFEEVSNDDDRRRALARLDDIQRDLKSRQRAIETPRRDLGARREREDQLREVLARHSRAASRRRKFEEQDVKRAGRSPKRFDSQRS
jgi:hypothetical protein